MKKNPAPFGATLHVLPALNIAGIFVDILKFALGFLLAGEFCVATQTPVRSTFINGLASNVTGRLLFSGQCRKTSFVYKKPTVFKGCSVMTRN